MNETSTDKLVRAVFGGPARLFIDFPLLVDSVDSESSQAVADRVLGNLSPRQRRVLELRFGFDDGKSKTLETVGKEFNVTRNRIMQIEAKALRILRHPRFSRELKLLFYEPTRDDLRAVTMRRRLFDELIELFPENLAYEMVMGIKRPYLKRALRELTRGNIARQVRLSCGLQLRYCKSCGAVTLPNWDFCSPECERQYRTLRVICDNCGQLFPRRDKVVIQRLGKMGYQHQFCSKRCLGQYAGNHWGFAAHPENTGRRNKKWDYSQIYTMKDEMGWGASRISRALGIPKGTVSVILSRREPSGRR